MKKHVAKKWVAALRSGEYEQGTHALQSFNAYCCLGVLCKIAPKSVYKDLLKHAREAGAVKGRLKGGHLASQSAVREWAGLKSDQGNLEGKSSLINANDTGASFEDIANIIEENWKEL